MRRAMVIVGLSAGFICASALATFPQETGEIRSGEEGFGTLLPTPRLQAAETISPVERAIGTPTISYTPYMMLRDDRPFVLHGVITGDGEFRLMEVPVEDFAPTGEIPPTARILSRAETEGRIADRARRAFEELRTFVCVMERAGYAPYTVNASVNMWLVSVTGTWNTEGMCED